MAQVSGEASRDNQRDIHGRFTTQTVLRLTWGSERFQAWLRSMGHATKYIGSELNPVELRNGQEIEPGAKVSKDMGAS